MMKVDCMSLIVDNTEIRVLAVMFDHARAHNHKHGYTLTSWYRALRNMTDYDEKYCIVFDRDDIIVLKSIIHYIIDDTKTGFGRYMKSLLATQLNEFLGKII